MKRKTLIICSVLAVAAIVGVGPWLVGKTVHNLLVSQVAATNVLYKQYGDKHIFRIKDYQTGWFTSKATLEWIGRLKDDKTKTENLISLDIEEVIQHGPIIWSMQDKIPHFALAKIMSSIKAQNSAVNDIVQLDQKEITATTKVSYLGFAKTVLDIERVSGIFSKELPFELNNLNINTEVDLKNIYKSGKSVVSLKEGTLKMGPQDTTQIKLSDFKMGSDYTASNEFKEMENDIKLSIASIEITGQGSPPTIMKDISMTGTLDNRSKNGNPFSLFDMKGQHANFQSQGINFGSLKYDFAVSNFDFMKFMQEQANNPPNIEKMKRGEELLAYFYQFRADEKKSIDIEYKTLTLKIPEGEFAFDGKVVISGTDPKNPQIDGKASATVFKDVFAFLNKMGLSNPELERTFKQYFMFDDGNEYKSFVLYRDGFYLNGMYLNDTDALYELPTDSKLDNTQKTLILAIWNDDAVKAQSLLKEGVLANFNMGDKGMTPLLIASQMGNRAIVEAILDKHIPVHQADSSGSDALYWAAKRGHKELVIDLLKRGASVNSQNNFGVTPLQIAAENNALPVAELLLTSQAEINKADKEGRTPLFLAAKSGNLDMVSLLLKNGADPSISTLKGISPRAIAEENKFSEVAKLLPKVNQPSKASIPPKKKSQANK